MIISGSKSHLIWAGKKYHLHHTSKNGAELWRCTKCGAKLKFLAGQGSRVLREDPHSCNKMGPASEFEQELKSRVVQQCHIPVAEIYRECWIKYVNSGLREDLIPPYTSMKTTLYRLRKRTLFPDSKKYSYKKVPKTEST